MRLAAAIGFLQMKRWGHQWLIVTCCIGLIVWIGYNLNMTFYADVRFASISPSRSWAGGSTTFSGSLRSWRCRTCTR